MYAARQKEEEDDDDEAHADAAVLAQLDADAAELKLARARERAETPDLAAEDRVCWAAIATAAHIAALQWCVAGGDAAKFAQLARPLAAFATGALLASLLRPALAPPLRLPGLRGGFGDTIWSSSYIEESDVQPQPSLATLAARKRVLLRQRSRIHQSRTAVPGASVPRAVSEGAPRSWEPSQASSFQLRGALYLVDKRKYASGPALYEPFGLDILRCRNRVFDLPGRAVLPPPTTEERNLPGWCPRILTQTMYFPGTPPPLVGPQRITEDGPPGWQVVCWWRASPQLCELLQKPKTEWPPHLKLWREYVEGAETASVLNGSLKGVGSVANIHQENIGLPRLLHQFNAKPVLMAAAAPPWGGDRQGVVHVSRNEDYLEFGLDVGADFAATSNHALFRLLPKLPRLVMDIAWIVEGRAPESLPENVLAAMRLNHLDFEAQAWAVDDWLRGPPGGFSSGESP
jgi:hypothetical protein